MILQAMDLSQPKALGLVRRHDEPCPMQLHPRARNSLACHQRREPGYICPNAQIRLNSAAPGHKGNPCRAVRMRLLARDLKLFTRVFASRANGHRNTDSSAVGGVHPRMVWNGKHQREWRLRCELCLHHTARKSLSQAVRGDEAKPLRLARADQFSRFVPPIQNEVGGFWHLGIRDRKSTRLN